MKDNKVQVPVMNEQIKADRVQLITYQGVNQGLVSLQEALRQAKDDGLDLVVISDKGSERVPVVKIMDAHKVLYEKKKKADLAKKKQRISKLKEVKLRPQIADHDYATMVRRMVNFLKDGDRVKVVLTFRGRENLTRDETGGALFDRIDRDLRSVYNDTLKVERDSRLDRTWFKIYFLKTKT
ncbi:MAG: translation initiation factor IF-3 [Candidatus Babeliales bacterium]